MSVRHRLFAQKLKDDYNEFLYMIMRQALTKKDRTEQESLECYIEQNFRNNLPNTNVWLKGVFASLKLTSDFYESDTAQRVFYETFGINTCEVNLVKMNVTEFLRDETDTEEIDATTDDSNMNPPKRKTKYPRKIPSTNFDEIKDETQKNQSRNFQYVGEAEVENSISTDKLNDETNSSIEANNLIETIKAEESFNIPMDSQPKTTLQNEFIHLSEPKSDQVPIALSDYSSTNGRTQKQCAIMIPKDGIDSPIQLLLNNINEEFQAQTRSIEEQFAIYLAETSPSKWSLEYFWSELLELNYQDDSNLPNSAMSHSASVKDDKLL